MNICYKPIEESDIADIKSLCEECFPVRYPERWYQSLTTNTKYFTLAAFADSLLVGMIVARIRGHSQCNIEDMDILRRGLLSEHRMVYILSLGVTQTHRKNGIASELFSRLMFFIKEEPSFSIKAVYLHVLTSNSDAITFYEHRGFVRCQSLPDYYTIGDEMQPAFSYVLYLNGGSAPRSVMSSMREWGQLMRFVGSCLLRAVVKLVRPPCRWLVSRLSQLAMKTPSVVGAPSDADRIAIKCQPPSPTPTLPLVPAKDYGAAGDTTLFSSPGSGLHSSPLKIS